MERKLSVIIAILLALSLILNIALLILLRSRGNITGFSVKEAGSEINKPVFENDVVEISKAELNKCCSFINAQEEEDGCYVIQGYDCAYCSDYCK